MNKAFDYWVHAPLLWVSLQLILSFCSSAVAISLFALASTVALLMFEKAKSNNFQFCLWAQDTIKAPTVGVLGLYTSRSS